MCALTNIDASRLVRCFVSSGELLTQGKMQIELTPQATLQSQAAVPVSAKNPAEWLDASNSDKLRQHPGGPAMTQCMQGTSVQT